MGKMLFGPIGNFLAAVPRVATKRRNRHTTILSAWYPVRKIHNGLQLLHSGLTGFARMFLFHVFKAIRLSSGVTFPPCRVVTSTRLNTLRPFCAVAYAHVGSCDGWRAWKRLWLLLYEITLLLFECVNGISISINKCHKRFAWVWLEAWKSRRRLVWFVNVTAAISS